MSKEKDGDLQERIEVMYEMGESCRGIGKIIGMDRMRVSKFLKSAGIEIRPLQIPIAPYRHFNGRKYRLDGRYYRATTNPETYLHVDIWVSHHGPLPEGWEVHHEDLDRLNNDITNLKGMEKSEHMKHHHYKTRGR